MDISKIALFGNPYQRGRVDDVSRFVGSLLSRGLEVEVHSEFHRYLCAQNPSFNDLPLLDIEHLENIDLALSIGGDGTLLRAAQRLRAAQVPVMGINTGHLGYLTTADITEADDALNEALTGKCRIEERTMLEASCSGVDGKLPLALNEVAILRHHISSMISMETTVNGVALTTYMGDGLVVCTPTGSTAYNLSAGGPILSPTTRCLVLSPVSPHSLTARPIVVPDDAEIVVRTSSRAKKVQLSIDGSSLLADTGATVRVKVADQRLKLMLRPNHNFAETLRKKLLWGARN